MMGNDYLRILTLTGQPTLSGRHAHNLSGCEAADRVEIRQFVRPKSRNSTIYIHFSFGTDRIATALARIAELERNKK